MVWSRTLLAASILMGVAAACPAWAGRAIVQLDGTARSVVATDGPVRAAMSTRSVPPNDVLATAIQAQGFSAPTTQVDVLAITWSGKTVSVPLSSYLDIHDPLDIALEPDGKLYRITIDGAADHFTYVAVLRFDRHRVLERRVEDQSDGQKNDIYERTVYSGELADGK